MIKSLVKSSLLHIGSLRYHNAKSKVFYYHDVHTTNAYTLMSTPLSLFSAHLGILEKEGFNIVSNIEKDEKEAMITFDDGFRGIYENFEFFQERRIAITVFLISGRIGEKNYMQRHEIETLLKTGLLKIGSHTVSHSNLDEHDDVRLKSELCDSKKKLEDMFGVEISDLCYPRGRFNKKIVEISKKSGYIRQFSCLAGSYNDSYMPGVIRRNFVQHETPGNFRAWVYGGGEIFNRRFEKLHIRN
jgi:peptidoglycan/xylan/chitin deacetylase (PgdA/CDA1 family)